jgi:N-acetylmuramoyl-L-alanine amidase
MTKLLQTTTLLLLLLFIVVSSPSAKTINVEIAGATEKVEALKEGDILYFSMSRLLDLLGESLDWQIIGHQIRYIDGGQRFDFFVESPFFKLNDTSYNMTYPAKMKDGELFLPAITFMRYLNQVRPERITYDDRREKIAVDLNYYNITDLAASQKANGLLIEIHLTSALNYDIYVTEGNWVNVVIRDGLVSPTVQSREDRRFMYDLKAHQSENNGQVSFRLKKNVERWSHRLVSDPPRIQISVADTDFQLDSGPAQVVGPDDKVDVIVIDAGHGGEQNGAVGPGGTREKDIALDISKELAKLIRKDKQFKVVMTRDRDKTVTLQERAEIGNAAQPDLFISIHANSSTKRKVRGWNVFFLASAKNDSARAVAQFENSAFVRELQESENEDKYGANPVLSILNEMIMTEFQTESHDFAMMIDREFRRNLQIPARGIDQAGFYVLNMVFCPSVLVETGFISNKTEEKLLRTKDYQKKVAEGIYEAIKRFKAKYESM